MDVVELRFLQLAEFKKFKIRHSRCPDSDQEAMEAHHTEEDQGAVAGEAEEEWEEGEVDRQ